MYSGATLRQNRLITSSLELSGLRTVYFSRCWVNTGFLLLLILFWFLASRVIRLTRDDPEFREWMPLLMRLCQVSLVGYVVSGTFLSLVHWDVIYYVMLVVVVTNATLRETLASRAKAGQVKQVPLSVAPPLPRRPAPQSLPLPSP